MYVAKLTRRHRKQTAPLPALSRRMHHRACLDAHLTVEVGFLPRKMIVRLIRNGSEGPTTAIVERLLQALQVCPAEKGQVGLPVRLIRRMAGSVTRGQRSRGDDTLCLGQLLLHGVVRHKMEPGRSPWRYSGRQ